MKIESMKIKYIDGFQCRQFKIRLDNDNLYLLFMALKEASNERKHYSYSLYEGNQFLFLGDQFSTPDGWETCGLDAMHCLLIFLLDQPEKWPHTADCNDIECYLYDNK